MHHLRRFGLRRQASFLTQMQDVYVGNLEGVKGAEAADARGRTAERHKIFLTEADVGAWDFRAGFAGGIEVYGQVVCPESDQYFHAY